MAAQTPNGQPAGPESVYSNGIPQTYPGRTYNYYSHDAKTIVSFDFTDALHLSIPTQGLPNGDAALPHAAYPGMQPYPGVGKKSHQTINLLSFYIHCVHTYCMFDI